MTPLNLSDVPGRVFLDTSVVNFIMDHGEEILEGADSNGSPNLRDSEDMDALRRFFAVGERAHWQLAVSPMTYREIMKTSNIHRKHHLHSWFMQIWDHWRSIIEESDDFPTFQQAELTRVNLLSSGALDGLLDIEDRMLICDAVVYNCDCFLTRDYRTILDRRGLLPSLPLLVLSPSELWGRIAPFAQLWL